MIAPSDRPSRRRHLALGIAVLLALGAVVVVLKRDVAVSPVKEPPAPSAPEPVQSPTPPTDSASGGAAAASAPTTSAADPGQAVASDSSPSSAKAPASQSAPSAPSTRGAPLTVPQFDRLAQDTLAKLPTAADTKGLSHDETHSAPEPIVRAGQLLGRIAEAVEGNPALKPQAFDFYLRCAQSAELLTPVRGLCYGHILSDPKAPPARSFPAEVVRLGRMIPQEGTAQ